MFVISLSYKTYALESRQSFAFDDEKTRLFLERLKNIRISEAVYLSTCNRCEIYVSNNVYSALSVLAEFSDVQLAELKNHVLIFEGKNAVRHLFSVTCGLESMVLGEDEILGQVKRSYAFSKEFGLTDYEFNTVFKSAVTTAKKIKTETRISKSSVSVATIAAAKCHKFAEGKKTVLIIGASGEIGSKICKNLLSYDEFDIFATVREKHIRESGMKIISYTDRYLYTDRADIIISATKSPHFTITQDRLSSYIKTQKPRLFIDLSVPRDIDEAVGTNDSAQLITVDDFEAIAEHNNNVKQRELESVKDWIDSELDELFKELSFHRSFDFLKSFSLKNGGDKFMRFVYKFRDSADVAAFDSFVETLKKFS